MNALAPFLATPLDLGSDKALRSRWFTAHSNARPAKLHLGLLMWLVERYTRPGETIADPMAGIGSTLLAASLQRNVIAREIEPRWLALAEENAARIRERAGLLAGEMDLGQHDAREPWGFRAQHIVFSPPYGCETSAATWRSPAQAAKLEALAQQEQERGARGRWAHLQKQEQDSGAWGSLTFDYGAHPAQVGHLRNAAYWEAMRPIYENALVALDGGVMAVIIKDHIRVGQRVCVADATVKLCESVGFALVARHQRRVWPMSLWTRRRKERGEMVVEEEDVLVFRVRG